MGMILTCATRVPARCATETGVVLLMTGPAAMRTATTFAPWTRTRARRPHRRPSPTSRHRSVMMIAMDRSAPETGAALLNILTGPAAMGTATTFAPWTLLTADHKVICMYVDEMFD